MYDIDPLLKSSKKHYEDKAWKELCLDTLELMTTKVNRICAENCMTIKKNNKESIDFILYHKLLTNPKIHQIRMLRNDIVFNRYELDKLDVAIIKATYKYILPFIKKQKFSKKIFE